MVAYLDQVIRTGCPEIGYVPEPIVAKNYPWWAKTELSAVGKD